MGFHQAEVINDLDKRSSDEVLNIDSWFTAVEEKKKWKGRN